MNLFYKKIKSYKGVFITFEGIDGAGKTTQIKLLSEFLTSAGFNVFLTREPGGTIIGEQLREILLSNKNDGISSKAECLLFLASRAELVEKVIFPKLAEGNIVICDRFFDSTIAYQGIARGLGFNDIFKMSLWATSGLIPDITFLLLLDFKLSNERVSSQKEKFKDRIEHEKDDFKIKICQGYIQTAERFKKRIKVIDASLGIDEIFNIIKRNTIDVLKKKALF